MFPTIIITIWLNRVRADCILFDYSSVLLPAFAYNQNTREKIRSRILHLSGSSILSTSFLSHSYNISRKSVSVCLFEVWAAKEGSRVLKSSHSSPLFPILWSNSMGNNKSRTLDARCEHEVCRIRPSFNYRESENVVCVIFIS